MLRSLIALVCLSAPALAHDFWIEATPGAVGAPVNVRLKIGPEFTAEDEYPFNPLHIVKFERIGPKGQGARFAGFTGQAPAGRFIPRVPGLYVIAYQSGPSKVELDPRKFEEYLREEGLSNVLTWRAENGEASRPGKEKFYRNAKAIVRIGEGGGGAFSRTFGMPFELVAKTDPTQGGRVIFQALVNDKPAPNLRVAAYSGPKAKPVEGRTDAKGEVALHLGEAGRWLVKSVNAQRASGDVDWRSDWASLTFEVKPQ